MVGGNNILVKTKALVTNQPITDMKFVNTLRIIELLSTHSSESTYFISSNPVARVMAF
jgi:hypothetical protein